MIKGPRLGWTTLRFGAWATLLFLTLPALIAVPVSLTPKRYLSMPEDALSLRHYANLFSGGDWLSSMLQSAIIASASAAIATALGTICAVGLWRIASRTPIPAD